MSTRSQSRCKTPGQPFALKSTLQALAAALLVAFNCLGVSSAAQEKGLRRLTFEAFALGSVKPTGWLKNQLEIQNGGLTGNLQKFWPDVKESGWIGGNAEGWERAPYWLDGAVPLAFLLDDGELQASVRRYIDYALRGQAQDGWLGPEESSTGNYKYRDPWPVYVMLKVLTQYQEATGDNRVIPAMNRFLKAVNRQLDERPLFSWNRMRWQDGVLSIHWLFERTKEPWLLDLADKMERQGYNWIWHFRDLPHKEKVEKWEHESHVVNNAMGVKAPAVWYRQSGDDFDRQTAFEALRALDRYHGQATGLFTGDECFAGRMPSQGTELCAVVEYMYSLEWLLQVVGDPSFGDRLERIAFNALPAQIKPDWWARQYVQQANQVVARVSEDRIYTTNGPEANVFGLDTNYGCCTANMHQGWPKFAAHLWMRSSDGGVAAIAYAPSSLQTTLSGVPVSIELATDYPFREELRFTVKAEKPITFPLHLRIPGWSDQPTIRIDSGASQFVKSGQFHKISRKWTRTTEVLLTLPMKVEMEKRYNDAVSIKRGPLVYSLKIDAAWRQYDGEKPHADWEVYPTSHWNYALQLAEQNPEASITFDERPLSENPFTPESAPIVARVKGRLLPEWVLEKNAAAPPPVSPVASDQPLVDLTLIPYGSTVLRVTEFPVLETESSP